LILRQCSLTLANLKLPRKDDRRCTINGGVASAIVCTDYRLSLGYSMYVETAKGATAKGFKHQSAKSCCYGTVIVFPTDDL